MSTPKVAVFTPMPPARSGIADYAAELAVALQPFLDATYVVEDGSAALKEGPSELDIVSLSEWSKDAKRDLATPRFYHQGNNPAHAFVYNEIQRRPGVTVLHDFVLHHLVAQMTLGNGDAAGYQEAMSYDHGRLGVELALQRQRYIFSEYQQFLLPLNGKVLDSSLGMLVHSKYAVDHIRSLRPQLPVEIVHHHLADPPSEFLNDNQASARKRLGLPGDGLVFTSLGFITPPKQVELTLRALAQVKDKLGSFLYILAGERSSSYDIDAKIEEAGLRDHVRVTGYLDMVAFHDHILASDVIINLRYPTAGETSGTLVRAMGMGRPAVIFDYGSFADYPDGVAVKTALDTNDAESLAGVLLDLGKDSDTRKRIGQAAKAYVSKVHHIDRSVESYVEAYHRWLAPRVARATPPLAMKSDVEKRPLLGIKKAVPAVKLCRDAITEDWAGDYFDSHSKRYEKTFARIPSEADGMSLLELGSYVGLLSAIKSVHGYDKVVGSDFDSEHPIGRMDDRVAPNGESYEFYNFNVEADPFPFASRSFDVVLCCEVLEHLTMDPMFMLGEINRVLKFGGMLLLTTPNLASIRSLEKMLRGYAPQLYMVYRRDRSTNRHNIEYTPHEVGAMFNAAGFDRVRVEAENCWSEPDPEVVRLLKNYDYPVAGRGDNIFATGFKQSEMIDRYPIETYDPGDRQIVHCEQSASVHLTSK